MVRAAARLSLITLILVTLTGAAFAAPSAQTGTLPPTIVLFSADAASVNYADVEAGTAQVTLTWVTLNTDSGYRIAIDSYDQNFWASIFGADENPPTSGSKLITVALPQNFGAPTYRLTLKTTQGNFVSQQFLTIPFSTPTQAPEIVTFTTTVPSIDTNLLVQNNARLVINWEITNRVPNLLIRFDQILPDGSAVSAELPRHTLWLPSRGQGAVVPRATSSKADLDFRMSLVNPADGTVYDQADLTVPVMGTVVMAPAATQEAQQSSSAQPLNTSVASNPPPEQVAEQPNPPETSISEQPAQADTSTGGEQPASDQQAQLSAQPENAQPGAVVINWDAGNAASFDLVQTVDNGGPKTIYIALPQSGSMQVPVPTDNASVTYTLRATSADGQVTTSEVTVPPPSQNP